MGGEGAYRAGYRLENLTSLVDGDDQPVRLPAQSADAVGRRRSTTSHGVEDLNAREGNTKVYELGSL